MKLAGLAILYYPDADFLKRLDSYKSYLDKLIIINNSEVVDTILTAKLQSGGNILIIQDGENKGIAKRLNEAAQLAINDDCEWLLTMDQDSFFPDNTVYIYLECIKSFGQKENVALFTVEYDERLLRKEDCSYKKVNKAITSGNIINLDIWQQTKGFDELLFIDHVDHEYCFQCLLQGYDIIKFDSILLQHQLGTVADYRSIKNLKRSSRGLHSPHRIYYIVRNFLYLSKKYSGKFSLDMKEIKKSILISIKNNLLYNNKRLKVLKYLIKGLIDFKKGNMGKLN
jgi:rhamnosyltransferase